MDAKLDLEGPHWRFALDFYGRPGVQEACLRLQDEHGFDIIALVAILHAAIVSGRGMDEEEIAALRRDMALWREKTVLTLRRLRRELKSPPPEFPAAETESLRDLIKKAELKAEQIQLALAAQWLQARTPRRTLPVEAALTRLAEGPIDPGNEDLATVIAAARAAAG